jgi:hypothetical protein
MAMIARNSLQFTASSPWAPSGNALRHRPHCVVIAALLEATIRHGYGDVFTERMAFNQDSNKCNMNLW